MSGVNWMREKRHSMVEARVLIASVLASPGTPSSSTWPSARQCQKQPLDQVVLAHEHLAHLGAHGIEPLLDCRRVRHRRCSHRSPMPLKKTRDSRVSAELPAKRGRWRPKFRESPVCGKR